MDVTFQIHDGLVASVTAEGNLSRRALTVWPEFRRMASLKSHGFFEEYTSKKEYKLAGPSWMDAETFAIDATMPPSTTQEQFRVMLQNLLAERFKLKAQRENRQMSAYSLVAAKNGPKLGVAGSIHYDRQGPATGTLSWTGLRVTMNELADKLTEETQRPVTDATALKEKYDFTLTFRRNATGLTPETEDRQRVSPGPAALSSTSYLFFCSQRAVDSRA